MSDSYEFAQTDKEMLGRFWRKIKIKFSHEFFIYYGANSMLARYEDQRRGQFLFNCLADFRPDLAEKLRGNPLDPYYSDSQIDAACLWIEENW